MVTGHKGGHAAALRRTKLVGSSELPCPNRELAAAPACVLPFGDSCLWVQVAGALAEEGVGLQEITERVNTVVQGLGEWGCGRQR